VDDRPIIAVDVDLFDARDCVHCEFLQRRLEFLIIGGSRLVDDLLLAARSA
jgi:hypothetical protein